MNRWAKARWRWLLLALPLGILTGTAGFTAQYAEGLAYLSNDPQACANCHVMQEQLATWSRGPHHNKAVCNDCHTPLPFLAKYLAKAMNGYHHSLGFTMQPHAPDAPGAKAFFREPIQIKPKNSQILQDNCIRCHGDFVHDIVGGSTSAQDAVRCVHCHRNVGHGARG